MDDGYEEDDEAFCNDDDADEIIYINDEDQTAVDVVDEMNGVQLDDEEETRNDSIFSHQEHNDEVFCVCFNPLNNNLIASGGKDDKALVWNSSDKKILFSCTGHKESIVSIGFSSDGSLLATGDLNGVVKVWKVETGSEIWSFEVEEIQWLCWHHKATLLLAGASDGNVWLWHIPFSQTKTMPSHGSPAICGKFMPDGKHACCGYEDGVVRIWDLKTATFICSVDTRTKKRDSSVLCIDAHVSGNKIIAGLTDGSALLLNPLNGQILFPYESPRKINETDEETPNGEDLMRIESVAFHPLESCNYVCTGNGRGEVNVWDMMSHTLRHCLAVHQSDVIKVRWHPTQPLIVSASADGSIVVQDARSGVGLAEYLGHRGSILDFDLSSDGSYIASCGEDNSVRIFKNSDIN